MLYYGLLVLFVINFIILIYMISKHAIFFPIAGFIWMLNDALYYVHHVHNISYDHLYISQILLIVFQIFAILKIYKGKTVF